MVFKLFLWDFQRSCGDSLNGVDAGAALVDALQGQTGPQTLGEVSRATEHQVQPFLALGLFALDQVDRSGGACLPEQVLQSVSDVVQHKIWFCVKA